MKKLLHLSVIGIVFIWVGCKKTEVAKPEAPPAAPPSNPGTPPVNYTPDQSFKIVAYFPSYRSPDSVAVSKYKMITHLFYAFVNPNTDGSLKALAQPSRFNEVTTLAKANGVKVGISVSGASADFEILASNSASRTRLVNNLVNFTQTYNLDGVDMDWEYPRTSLGSDVTYSLLMKELSDSLHRKNKYLSAAITAGVYPGAVRDGIRSDVFESVDFFNIMVYDGLGWDAQEPKQHASYRMATTSLDVWLQTKNMPKEKAILGIPSYGKNDANIAKGYRDLINAGAKPALDSTTSAGQLYYYNGTHTVKKKAMLAKERANGIMFWEFYFDTNNNTSLLKAANDTLGRTY